MPTDWLDLAKEAYSISTEYVDNNFRKKWSRAIKFFYSEHPPGSKYLKPAFKYRSKVFRPKTRAAIRSNEAAAMLAFFANQDIIDIQPSDPNNPLQTISAEIMKYIIDYRLTVTIPWFLTCLGAYQEAMTFGAVCSYQGWEYEEKEEEYWEPLLNSFGAPVIDAITGEPVLIKKKRVVPVKDQPTIKLVPIENVRIHPGADWTNPVESSPFFIELIPMYIDDIKARMSESTPFEKRWKQATEQELLAATQSPVDITRLERQKGMTDRYQDVQPSGKLSGMKVAWVHRNFIRQDGEDFVFYTLGTHKLLSDPVPIEEVYFTGERPYVIGTAVLEAHQILSSGITDLGATIQNEINELANQRLDNIKLVLNKRYIVRRGRTVDVASLLRNVPGSVTMADDPDQDIRELNWPDVTSSAYAEQDRLNLDFDEVVGAFSASTIQSNRRMNETVGGMAILKGAVSALTEYTLRTFVETWVEPVLRQLVKLEAQYETDTVILNFAAGKSDKLQRYGINRVTDEMLNQSLTLKVSVGQGATDPMMKINNLLLATRAVAEIAEKLPPTIKINIEEMAKAIFSAIGYRDGGKFITTSDEEPQADPEKVQMMMMIRELQAQLQQLAAAVQDKQADRQLKFLLEKEKQLAEDRRKAAELEAKIAMKKMDLLNPVPGEKIRRKKASA